MGVVLTTSFTYVAHLITPVQTRALTVDGGYPRGLPLSDNIPSNDAEFRPPEIRSIEAEAWEQAIRERWYRSERAGRNVGDSAIIEWIKLHWAGFFRSCWVQHLMGECRWAELSLEEFGLLRKDFGTFQQMVNAVVEKLRRGAENLTFFCWSRELEVAEKPQLREVLQLIDINGHRRDWPATFPKFAPIFALNTNA